MIFLKNAIIKNPHYTFCLKMQQEQLLVRLNIVLPGLSVPEMEGLLHAYSTRGLTFDYFPSVSEWLVFIWSISLAGLIFLLGKTYLPILDDKGNESLS